MYTEKNEFSLVVRASAGEEIMKVGNRDATLFQVTTSSFTDLDNQNDSMNLIDSLNQEELCFIKTTNCDTTIPLKKRAYGSPTQRIRDHLENLHRYCLIQMRPTNGLMVWRSPKHR